MVGFALGLIITFLPPVAHAGVDGNTYRDPDTGFAITKPADWQFVKEAKAYGLKLKDDTVMKAANRTVVAFAQEQEKSFFGVRPTVGVERLKLPRQMSAVDWLSEEMRRQAEHDKHFVPSSPALATTIDQVKSAARAAYVNSTVISGREVKVYHALYVVPSGGQVYLVHMNCSESLVHQVIDAFGKIADSIHAREN